MKKFNSLIAAIVLLYGIAAFALYWWRGAINTEKSQEYKVEINRLMAEFTAEGAFYQPDLLGMKRVCAVDYLDISNQEYIHQEILQAFFHSRNGKESFIQPLFAGETLKGFVRFDYITACGGRRWFGVAESVLLFSGMFVLAVLLYIRKNILKPFHRLSDLAFELSKGHLQGELEEGKNRFFGKFVWGIVMLRDSLSTAKAQALKLEKDKKMLLLSLSHDIKIPLSTIQLYAKALKEGVYQTEEQKLYAAAQIAGHAAEIEQFVKEIITTSSEDILAITVEEGEFYLKALMNKVQKVYVPKCRLAMTEFQIGSYADKLLKGDIERAFETLENLLENALKYGDGKRISIDFYMEEYCQIIRVYNTGIPVSAEELPHLFDSFYRGSNVEGKAGNGLGLYIGREIMCKMDGELFAERTENGMRFCMVLQIR